MEAEWSCEGGKGGKGLHGGCWGALQEGILCVRQRLCQAHCCNLLAWPLQNESKQQQSEGVALSDPALRGDYSPGDWCTTRWLASTTRRRPTSCPCARCLRRSASPPAQRRRQGLRPCWTNWLPQRTLMAAVGTGSGWLWDKRPVPEGGEPAPDFAHCEGPEAAGWLDEGEEAGIEEAGKVASDCCWCRP
jgi:hypothetical protein